MVNVECKYGRYVRLERYDKGGIVGSSCGTVVWTWLQIKDRSSRRNRWRFLISLPSVRIALERERFSHVGNSVVVAVTPLGRCLRHNVSSHIMYSGTSSRLRDRLYSWVSKPSIRLAQEWVLKCRLSSQHYKCGALTRIDLKYQEPKIIGSKTTRRVAQNATPLPICTSLLNISQKNTLLRVD